MPRLRFRIAALLLLVVALPATGAPPAADHVLVISVDGLRSDALLAPPRGALPHLRRLAAGAATLNARTDPAYTVTLPNHVGMVTGRHTRGSGGHGCMINDFDEGDPLLHERAGGYLPSMFDVAHDRGVFTGLFATKSKFRLLDLSWDAAHGAADAVAPDHGRDKIDRAVLHASDSVSVTDAALGVLGEGHPRSLMLLHYARPDAVGHAEGWDLTVGSPYLQSIAAIDVEIGRLLAAASAPPLEGRVTLILSSDHGGGAPHRSHVRPEMWINYVIPFLVWSGDGAESLDLYAANAGTRRDPGLRQPAASADPPPIRNSDAANLALDLLGLPGVPGARVNAGQDLKVR